MRACATASSCAPTSTGRSAAAHYPVLLMRLPYDKADGRRTSATRHPCVVRPAGLPGGRAGHARPLRARTATFAPFLHEAEDGYDTIEWAAAPAGQPTDAWDVRLLVPRGRPAARSRRAAAVARHDLPRVHELAGLRGLDLQPWRLRARVRRALGRVPRARHGPARRRRGRAATAARGARQRPRALLDAAVRQLAAGARTSRAVLLGVARPSDERRLLGGLRRRQRVQPGARARPAHRRLVRHVPERSRQELRRAEPSLGSTAEARDRALVPLDWAPVEWPGNPPDGLPAGARSTAGSCAGSTASSRRTRTRRSAAPSACTCSARAGASSTAWPPGSRRSNSSTCTRAAAPTPRRATACCRPRIPATSRPDAYIYDPLGVVPRTGGHSCCVPSAAPMGPACQCDAETAKTMLVYTSAPLEREVVLIGDVRATLYAASSAVDTDFAVRLCVVDPGGCSRNLQEGIVRRARPRSDERAIADRPRTGLSLRDRARPRRRPRAGGRAAARRRRELGLPAVGPEPQHWR